MTMNIETDVFGILSGEDGVISEDELREFECFANIVRYAPSAEAMSDGRIDRDEFSDYRSGAIEAGKAIRYWFASTSLREAQFDEGASLCNSPIARPSGENSPNR